VGDEIHKCAYCECKLTPGAEVYGLGVKLKEELEYPGAVGRSMTVELPIQGRELACMVTADGSQARLEGWDLIFMVCSEECGAALKALLQGEDLFEEMM
jgi:hypothetical protein